MHLHVHQQLLSIELSFWERVWGVHGSFHIPLGNVKKITMELPQFQWMEWRVPGTFLPGVIKAGTYYSKRGKEFWYVTRGHKKHITIELQNERYKRIVLSLPIGMSIPNALLQIR